MRWLFAALLVAMFAFAAMGAQQVHDENLYRVIRAERDAARDSLRTLGYEMRWKERVAAWERGEPKIGYAMGIDQDSVARVIRVDRNGYVITSGLFHR